MVNFFMLILIYSGVYALMAIGQNCITGSTGMLSLCHAGFFCIGSYATAIVCKVFGLSFWLSLPVAAIAAGFVGFLIGVPTLRLKGDYLCIATLGLGEIINLFRTAKAVHVPWPLYIGPAVTLILGIVMFFFPEQSGNTLFVLFGATLLLYSVSEFASTYTIRRAMKNVEMEIDKEIKQIEG